MTTATKVDHKQEAERHLREAQEFGKHRRDESMALQQAAIHAQLALLKKLDNVQGAILALQNQLPGGRA